MSHLSPTLQTRIAARPAVAGHRYRTARRRALRRRLLGGSLGRGRDDALSELDLHVVVADAAGATLCARPTPREYGTTPARWELFARFGVPSFVYESHNNAPAGGSFSTVIYAPSQVVDWVLIP